RNVACSGAVPIGATNCLNFGNPEKPEVMGQLVKAIRGMGEACRRLEIPITGGNVSLYNETDGRAIYPTPVMGVVGLLEDEEPGLGGRFDLPGGLRPDVLVFSETPSRAVVTTPDELRIAELARRHGVPWARVGVVGGGRLTLVSGGAALVDLPLERLHEAWMSLESLLSTRSAS